MWKSGALQSISDFEEANAEHARFLKAAIRAEVCPQCQCHYYADRPVADLTS